jgi:DNA-binding beta-propeller fold protein YncE
VSAARYVSVVVALTGLLWGPARAECWHLNHQWPSDGNPVSIAVDASGHVYVVCHEADHAVQKYSTNGKLLAEWGQRGSGPGQLLSPRGIAVDGAGNVYVADTGNHRVQKFRRDGAFVRAWRTYGKGKTRTFRPYGIATDPSRPYVYVTDDANSRVLKFTDRGFAVRVWGGYGTAQDQFLAPRHVTTDNAGLVYVVDSAAGCVKKFNHLGEFKGLWGDSDNQTPYFVNPVGVAVDCAGYLWVTDGSHRVQQFWQAVRRRGWFGGSSDPQQGHAGCWHRFDSAHQPVAGAGPGQFRDPCGLAVDLAGNLYVADFANRRIQKLASLETGAPGMLSRSAWSSAASSR